MKAKKALRLTREAVQKTRNYFDHKLEELLSRVRTVESSLVLFSERHEIDIEVLTSRLTESEAEVRELRSLIEQMDESGTGTPERLDDLYQRVDRLDDLPDRCDEFDRKLDELDARVEAVSEAVEDSEHDAKSDLSRSEVQAVNIVADEINDGTFSHIQSLLTDMNDIIAAQNESLITVASTLVRVTDRIDEIDKKLKLAIPLPPTRVTCDMLRDAVELKLDSDELEQPTAYGMTQQEGEACVVYLRYVVDALTTLRGGLK